MLEITETCRFIIISLETSNKYRVCWELSTSNVSSTTFIVLSCYIFSKSDRLLCLATHNWELASRFQVLTNFVCLQYFENLYAPRKPVPLSKLQYKFQLQFTKELTATPLYIFLLCTLLLRYTSNKQYIYKLLLSNDNGVITKMKNRWIDI